MVLARGQKLAAQHSGKATSSFHLESAGMSDQIADLRPTTALDSRAGLLVSQVKRGFERSLSIQLPRYRQGRGHLNS